MRNYLKYIGDTVYSFRRKYNLSHNQLMFLIFINDEKGSFTKRYIRESMYISKDFNDVKFPELVKRDYVFCFEKRAWNSHKPNKYRITSKTKRLIHKFYNVLEGTEEI